MRVIVSCALRHNVAKYLRHFDHFGEDKLNQEIEKVEDDPEEQNLRLLGQWKRDQIKDIIYDLAF